MTGYDPIQWDIVGAWPTQVGSFSYKFKLELKQWAKETRFEDPRIKKRGSNTNDSTKTTQDLPANIGI
jgi:hypothetical protein